MVRFDAPFRCYKGQGCDSGWRVTAVGFHGCLRLAWSPAQSGQRVGPSSQAGRVGEVGGVWAHLEGVLAIEDELGAHRVGGV